MSTNESRWPCFDEWVSVLREFYRGILLRIGYYLIDRYSPTPNQIVAALTKNVSSLELVKDEYLELKQLTGAYGPFRLSGTALPVFEYTVFEKGTIRVEGMDAPTQMEFIRVRVEVAMPDQIRFIATIDSDTAPEYHGKVIETKSEYQAPFNTLALHLYRYFPFHNKKRSG